jgi:hypothetical protein
MIAIARLSRTERHLSKANCAMRSVSRPTIRASNQIKTLTIEIQTLSAELRQYPLPETGRAGTRFGVEISVANKKGR